MILTVNKIIGVYDKSKAGVPFVTKTNKPYKKATVQFLETGEKMVTVMVWQNGTCDIGQKFEGEIAEREYNGQKYYDLKVVSEKDKTENRIGKIEFSNARAHHRLDRIEEFLKGRGFSSPSNTTSAGTKVPDFQPMSPEEQASENKKMHDYEVSIGTRQPDDLNGELDMIAEEDLNTVFEQF